MTFDIPQAEATRLMEAKPKVLPKVLTKVLPKKAPQPKTRLVTVQEKLSEELTPQPVSKNPKISLNIPTEWLHPIQCWSAEEFKAKVLDAEKECQRVGRVTLTAGSAWGSARRSDRLRENHLTRYARPGPWTAYHIRPGGGVGGRGESR